jgi:hypothetical protein
MLAMTIKQQLSTLLFFLIAIPSLQAQMVCGLGEYQHQGCEHGLQGTGVDEFSFVPPPADFDPNAERAVVITVNYNNFPTNAQAAFDYAVDIWASTLTSSVPIVIDANWQSLSGGTLGFAGAQNLFRNFPGAEQSNTYYAAALANKLRGSDNAVGQGDITCTFNSNFNWYFGTDGNTPGGQYDFVTVVLHELCHGLGFFGSASVSGSQGFLEINNDPVIYDTFVELNNGTDLTSLSNGSTALGDALTSNNLYWNGVEGVASNGGTRPRMYAPGTFASGSSYSHLNENTYTPGNVNSLMTPFLGTAEANHDPGPIVLGIFEDIGWTLGNECLLESVSLINVGECNPELNRYAAQIEVTYTTPPPSGLLSVNGNLYTVTGSPQTVNIGNLVANGQNVDVTVFFTIDPDCSIFENNLWQAPSNCCQDPRLSEVNPENETITITNYGTCNINLANHRLSSGGSNVNINSLNVVSGTLIVNPNASVTLSWTAWNPPAGGIDMALYSPFPDLNNPEDMLDFMQFGSGGNGRESVAVAKGIWGAGDFVSGLSPFNYIGDGDQNGVAFWEGASPPCSLNLLTTGVQSACDPLTNTYNQALLFTFEEAPAGGQLTVNGQNFDFSTSPAIVNLLDLVSDGNPQNVNAFFSDDPTCAFTGNAVFTAPTSCFCPRDLNLDGQVDVQDLLVILAEIGCTANCSADLNNDGSVGSSDVLIFLPDYGTVCPQ